MFELGWVFLFLPIFFEIHFQLYFPAYASVWLWSTPTDNLTPISPFPYSSVQFKWCSNVGCFFRFFPYQNDRFFYFKKQTFSALFPCVRICMPLVNTQWQLDIHILNTLELYYLCAYFCYFPFFPIKTIDFFACFSGFFISCMHFYAFGQLLLTTWYPYSPSLTIPYINCRR